MRIEDLVAAAPAKDREEIPWSAVRHALAPRFVELCGDSGGGIEGVMELWQEAEAAAERLFSGAAFREMDGPERGVLFFGTVFRVLFSRFSGPEGPESPGGRKAAADEARRFLRRSFAASGFAGAVRLRESLVQHVAAGPGLTKAGVLSGRALWPHFTPEAAALSAAAASGAPASPLPEGEALPKAGGFLLCGVGGPAKSAFSAPGALVLSSASVMDEFGWRGQAGRRRAMGVLLARLEKALERPGRTVVAEAPFLDREERAPFIAAFRAAGKEPVAVWFEEPFGRVMAARRSAGERVSREGLSAEFDRAEPPDVSEGVAAMLVSPEAPERREEALPEA